MTEPKPPRGWETAWADELDELDWLAVKRAHEPVTIRATVVRDTDISALRREPYEPPAIEATYVLKLELLPRPGRAHAPAALRAAHEDRVLEAVLGLVLPRSRPQSDPSRG